VLSAANKTSLLIDGDADLHLTIYDHTINKLLLVQNKCHWDFAAGTIYIGNRQVHAYRREQVGAHRWLRLLCR